MKNLVKKISSQKASLRIDEDTRDLLDKYCTPRTVSLDVLVDQIISAWVERAVRAWRTNPSLVPVLPKVSERKTVEVTARKPLVDKYKKACELFEVDPVSLLSWLTRIYAKQKNLKRLSEYKNGRRPWKT